VKVTLASKTYERQRVIDGDGIIYRIASGFAAEDGGKALRFHSLEAVAKPGVLIRSALPNRVAVRLERLAK